jgi:hypothetical protein
MLLQNKQNGHLVEILDIKQLFDPTQKSINGQYQVGQEEQDPEDFQKQTLIFPSGEELPRCWLDANYNQPVASHSSNQSSST